MVSSEMEQLVCTTCFKPGSKAFELGPPTQRVQSPGQTHPEASAFALSALFLAHVDSMDALWAFMSG